MCRWWSGCTDSWMAQSGRPRRTKLRDWCSSGRWDAGPSDNLWSERGETRRAEPGMKRGKVKKLRRSGYGPLFCLDIKGCIQRGFSFSLKLLVPPFFSSLSQNKTQPVFSPVDIITIFPQESQLHQACFFFSLLGLFFFVAFFLHACKQASSLNAT